MAWHLVSATVTVKDGERALVSRNGQLERVLAPGRHRLFDPLNRLTVELCNVVRTEFSAERYAVVKAARPDLVGELFEAIETGANEIAIVSLDGRPVHLMTPWQARVYWKVATSVDVERIDVAEDPRVSAASPRDDRAQPPDHRRRRPWSRTTRPACCMSRAGWSSGSRRAGTRSGSPAARSRSSASTCVRRRWRSPRRRC